MLKKLLSAHYLLFATVLIIASFFRLYNISQLPPGFYPDEAIYANNGVEAWETDLPVGGFKVFYPENNGREGLWPNIIGFFIVNFGHEPWVSRSIAAIFGILTVLGVYFLTKELFSNNLQGEKIALLSSFLIATSFWHILFSRIGFRAIMAPFFLVWGIYFLLVFLNRINENQKLKIIIYSVLGGVFFGLGFHTYIAYRAMPLLILVILALYWLTNKTWGVRKKIVISALYFLLFTFIVALPLGLYFLKNPADFFGRTGQISIFNSPTLVKNLGMNILKTAGMFNFSGDWNWRHNYAGKPELFWPIGALFLTGIFLGLRIFFEKVFRRLSGNDLQAFIILFSWLIIAVLPTVISNEGLPHALRALLMIPPIFVLAGFGGIWLIENIKNKISKIKNTNQNSKFLNFTLSFYVLIFTFFIWLIFNAYYSYFIQWGKNQNVQGAFSADYVQIGRELNVLPKELPKYVIVEASGVDVRGIPMPAQTVMFITDTFTPEKQKEKNIFYVLPEQKNQIPENSYKIILK